MGRTKVPKRRKLWLPLLVMAGVFAVGVVTDYSMAQDTAATSAAEAAPATPPPPAPDSTGANAGGVGNITAATSGAPTVLEVADRVGKNVISINIVWTLITGFLVMFMQAGFALVETGLCRAKNSAHTMSMNFMIYPLGMIGFYVCGFAFMFGGCGGNPALGASTAVLDSMYSITIAGKTIQLLGYKGFFLGPSVYDCGIFALFLFQMVFMDTTATIPTGTMAERWKFSAFVLYGLCIGTIMYPVYGCWMWGGGWLSQLGATFGLGHGAVDFAGSSVVHMQGGVIALIGGWMIGPRLGKYNKDGSINPIAPHNIPMVMLGTFILAFGWFGFNPGSTLAGTDDRIAIVATNTMLASATAAFATYLWMVGPRRMKPDPSMLCNGMLAGLVAITAPCAFVTSLSACFIGIVAGILVVEAVFFIDRVLKVDDCVGAISVHGVNGLWGILSLGLLADGTYGAPWNGVHLFKLTDGTFKVITDLVATPPPTGAAEQGVTGLFYGNPNQFWAECIAGIACFTYLAIISWVVFTVTGMLSGGIRVSPQVELEGVDIPEMGVEGYYGFQMDKAAETPHSH
ncbi:MAG TPA: ammonium transporter [Lacipirellulaceae bacterium]|jgi:Amt family ammonium transporter